LTEFYLDVETLSLSPELDFSRDRVISVCLAELDRTGSLVDAPVIINAWDSSDEIKMLEKLRVLMFPKYKWDFIPVGDRLVTVDFLALSSRFAKHKMSVPDLYQRPYIDLYSTLVLVNNDSFRGSGAVFRKFGKDEDGGKHIREWFEAGDYDKINRYQMREAYAFGKVYPMIKEKLAGIV
jgi:hypothetical protein